MGTKTSLKQSTKRKGELRIAQQKALADEKAGRGAFAPGKKPKAKPKAPAAAPKAKAKRKSSGGAIGLAQKLRARFPK